MVEKVQRFDPRISPFTLSVKDMATPQAVYFDKAANVRAERIDGIVHLYRLADIGLPQHAASWAAFWAGVDTAGVDTADLTSAPVHG